MAIRVAGNLDCNDGELLFDWVKQGLGIGWRSTWEIQAELKRGELVTVLDEYALPAYDIRPFTRSSATCRPRCVSSSTT